MNTDEQRRLVAVKEPDARRSARIEDPRPRENPFFQFNRKQRRKLAAEYRKQSKHAL